MSKTPTKIEKKIVGYAVVKQDDKPSEGKLSESNSSESKQAAPMAEPALPAANQEPEFQPTIMGEHVARPSVLTGTTYKIEKSPASEHAMYVTINDIVLDPGTEHQTRRPFEIFINSKNMDQFQWVVAMTRIISAVFRKGGDVSFLAEEMKAVFDPKGGYWKVGGGGYVPSLVAEIGQIIEIHLQSLGLIDKPEMDAHASALIAEKRAALAGKSTKSESKTEAVDPKAVSEHASKDQAADDGLSFPANATLCHKCSMKSIVIMDGCATCLNCGYSKCG